MLSPAAITNDFSGHLDLRISNLNTGSAVIIERFQVNNSNGIVDDAAVLLSSYHVAEGVTPMVSGVTNTTVVADLTPADGVIQARIEYLDPFVQNLTGEYVIRVSSPTGAFAPAAHRLTVAPETHPQRFRGQARAEAGAVPFAGVALLAASGAGGEFVAGAVADASGNYEIQAPAGSYYLIAARPGYVGHLGRSTLARLNTNATENVNLTMERGTRTISGRLFDLGQPERGLAGVQLFGSTPDDAKFTIAYTDAEGNWTLPVTPEVWRISVLPQAVAAAGYVGMQDELYLDAEAEDVRGVNLGLPKATRLVRGTVRDASDQSPLSDCAVELWSTDLEYKVRVSTDAQGKYLAPVFEGEWFQAVNPESVLENGYAGTLAIRLNVSRDQVLESNLFLKPLAAEVSGSVVDDQGQPVAGVILAFHSAEASNRSWTTTQSDGSGNFYGAVGEGILRASVDLANSYYDLIDVEAPPFRAAPDANIELKRVMKRPTSRLQVRVVDNHGQPVTDLPLFAEARINNAVHRTFDYTDEAGVADLGVIPGEWTVRFDQSNVALSLETYGYFPTTNRLSSITGSDQKIEVILTPLPAAGPPKLSIAAAGSRIRVSWPSSAGTQGFGLQSAPSVAGPWTNVIIIPSATGDSLGVEVEASNPAGFFRLRGP